jgi:hypothetical protein
MPFLQTISQKSGYWFSKGPCSIAGTSVDYSALHWAAACGRTSIVEWLLAEGGANVSDVDDEGFTALLFAAENFFTGENVKTIQWLLEHGGADITDTAPNGRTVWDLLVNDFTESAQTRNTEVDRNDLTVLLRVMVLHCAPLVELVVQMSPQSYKNEPSCIPRTAPGPPCRAHIANRTAPGPGQQLRGAHDDREALGHGARRTSLTDRAASLTHLSKGSDGIVGSIFSITDIRYLCGEITKLCTLLLLQAASINEESIFVVLAMSCH